MKKILYRADINSPSGYSRAARAHVKALLDVGIEPAVVLSKHDREDFVPDTFWAMTIPRLIHRGPEPENSIKIWHETPEFFDPTPNQKNVGMVAWETSRVINYDLDGNSRCNWAKQMNKMDEIWTFAESASAAFKDSGVTVPIAVIPHPIDSGLYSPGRGRLLEDEFGNGVSKDKFVILSVFQWTKRKNPMDLLVSYWLAFQGREDVVLILKTYGSGFGDTQNIITFIKSWKDSMRLPNLPKVQLLFSHISEADMPVLYRSCDLFASLPFGEGFGLPFQEAMVSEKPVLYPKSSSMLDFCNDGSGYGVNVITEPVYGMGHIPWYQADQRWWKVEVDHAIVQFRAAYEDWKTGKIIEKGKLAREQIKDLHSHQIVGKMMKVRLELLSNS